MRRYRWMRAAAALLALAVILPAVAAEKRSHKKRNAVEEWVSDKGHINWEKGVLYATGLGAINNRESNQAKAYLRARAFARLDALRNLLMVVDHVRIDSRTVGSDFEAASDEIRAEVKGIVKGAQVVSERRIPVGGSTMVEVTVATPMYGEQGIAQVFIPEAIQRSRESDTKRFELDDLPESIAPEPIEPRELPRVRPPRREPPEEPPIARELPRRSERYTSLIIDARGFGIWRGMAPKIRVPDGSEVWGTMNVNPDFVIERGIVVYAHSLAAAKRDGRAGGNPLIVRAIGRGAAKTDTDPVITEQDAARILRANAQGGFLEQCSVIFVLDRGQ